MVVSPDEGEIVCIQSSGKVNLVNLQGLERRSPSHFELSSNLLSAKRNDAAQVACALNALVDMVSEEEYYLFDDEDQMSSYSSESSDSSDELDVIPD